MKRLILALAAACLLAGCGTPTHVAQSAGGSVHPPGWGRPAPGRFSVPATLPPSMVMFDSINVAEIPSSAPAAAGYTSGFWPTFTSLRSRLPKAHAISVAINVLHYAQCLDVEPGDATPGQAAGWVRADIRAGFKKPCVYSSWWEFTHQVIPALNAAHIPRSSVFEWDADYTHIPHLDQGFDATQWTEKALGRNLDESVTSLQFLTAAVPAYVFPKPKPKPAPKPKRTICFGKHVSESGCTAVLLHWRWLTVRRDTWHHRYLKQHCARLSRAARKRNVRGCGTSLYWWALRRGQAVKFRRKYS